MQSAPRLVAIPLAACLALSWTLTLPEAEPSSEGFQSWLDGLRRDGAAALRVGEDGLEVQPSVALQFPPRRVLFISVGEPLDTYRGATMAHSYAIAERGRMEVHGARSDTSRILLVVSWVAHISGAVPSAATPGTSEQKKASCTT